MIRRPREAPATRPAKAEPAAPDRQWRDDDAIAWAIGYRAALADLETLTRSRVTTLLNDLFADLRADSRVIEHEARGQRTRTRLRSRETLK